MKKISQSWKPTLLNMGKLTLVKSLKVTERRASPSLTEWGFAQLHQDEPSNQVVGPGEASYQQGSCSGIEKGSALLSESGLAVRWR